MRWPFVHLLTIFIVAHALGQEPDLHDEAIFVYEVIEVDRAEWTRWTANPDHSIRGPELRDHVQQLLENDKATVAQLALVRSASGQRVRASRSTRSSILPNGIRQIFQTALDRLEHSTRRLLSHRLRRRFGLFIEGSSKLGMLVSFWSSTQIDHRLIRLGISISIPRSSRTLASGSTAMALANCRLRFSKRNASLKKLAGLKPGLPRFVGSTRPHVSVDGARKDPVNLNFIRLDVLKFDEPPGASAPASIIHSNAKDLSFMLEWIQVEQADLHKILGKPDLSFAGDDVRSEIAKLITAGAAEVIETTAMQMALGTRQKSQSIEEVIYPSTYDPPEYTNDGEFILEAMPAALETTYVGFTVDVDPDAFPDGRGVDLKLNYEYVALQRLLSWGPRKDEITWPEFHAARVIQATNLPFGDRQLISTLHFPQEEESTFEEPRVLVFAKVEAGEVVPVPLSEDAVVKDIMPTQLTVVFEIFETTQAKLDALLVTEGVSAAGPELHNRLNAEATLVETVVQTAMDENRTKVESIDEFVYPSEYDPPFRILKNDAIVPPNPAAFKTRNVGLTLEFETLIGIQGWIYMTFNGEMVSLNKITEYFEDEVVAKVPEFHTQRLTQSSLLRPGQLELLGTTRPHVEKGREDAIWVWFARAEILPIRPPKF